MLSKNTTYLPQLDHLRFFAAFLVMAYHWRAGDIINGALYNPLMLLVKEGEIGVSLFMVLSGFILTHISIGKQVSYRTFLFNRLVRIYPLYTAVLFISVFGVHRTDFLSFLALLSPIGNIGAALADFPQTWTIPVEFQFYLIFPFLVMFLTRHGTRYILGLVGFAIVIRCMLYLDGYDLRFAAYWTILGRIDQFAVGMVAAVLYGKRERILASPVALAGSVIALYAWVWLFNIWTGGYYGKAAELSPAWIISPTVEAAIWAAFALTYLKQMWRMPDTLDQALRYLGAISFSLYVWHVPVIALIRRYPQVTPFPYWYLNFAFIVFPIVVGVSSLSYFVIEKPFFSLRRGYAKQPALTIVERVDEPARVARL